MPASAATWLRPSANPRCRLGKASVRMATELAVSIDPPKAWTSRHPISHCAPRTPVYGHTERRMDERVNTTKPAL